MSNLSIFLYIYPHSYSSLIFIHIFGSRLTYLSQSNHVISYRLSPLPYLPCFTSRIRTVYWKCNNTMIVTEHRKSKKKTKLSLNCIYSGTYLLLVVLLLTYDRHIKLFSLYIYSIVIQHLEKL